MISRGTFLPKCCEIAGPARGAWAVHGLCTAGASPISGFVPNAPAAWPSPRKRWETPRRCRAAAGLSTVLSTENPNIFNRLSPSKCGPPRFFPCPTHETRGTVNSSPKGQPGGGTQRPEGVRPTRKRSMISTGYADQRDDAGPSEPSGAKGSQSSREGGCERGQPLEREGFFFGRAIQEDVREVARPHRPRLST